MKKIKIVMRGFYFPATVKNRVFPPQIWPTGGPIGAKGLKKKSYLYIKNEKIKLLAKTKNKQQYFEF